MKKVLSSLVFVLLLAPIPASLARTNDSTVFESRVVDVVTVAFLVDDTSDDVRLSAEMLNAATLAIEQLNSDYPGTVFSVQMYDSKSTEADMIVAGEDAITDDPTFIVEAVNPTNSFMQAETALDRTTAMEQLAAGAGYPMFTVGMNSPALRTTTGSANFAFRLSSTADEQGDVMAFIVQSAGYDEATVVFVDDAYGNAVADQFTSTYEEGKSGNALFEGGGVVGASISFESADASFGNLVKAVEDQGSDVVVIIAYADDGEALITEMADKELDIPALYADGVAHPDIFELTPDSGDWDNVVVISPGVDITDRDTSYSQFEADYQSRFTVESGMSLLAEDTTHFSFVESESEAALLAQVYDSVMLGGSTVFEQDTTDSAALIAAIEASEYNGASGQIAFSVETRDRDEGSFSVNKVDDEELDRVGLWSGGEPDQILADLKPEAAFLAAEAPFHLFGLILGLGVVALASVRARRTKR